MAARGTNEKLQIMNKMLEVCPDSFCTVDGKELRIPVNGIEIKVSLTAAKDVLGSAAGVTCSSAEVPSGDFNGFPPPIQKTVAEPTQEELDNVSQFVNALGLDF